ncbi:hypothetical protein JKF63_06098 [Porcisia hertigi]|uniref:Uncharacterized protein n=1 Tax=Porcisia hertigi TaxID=2761500 RepID=A0A836LGZ8_9TRYP|nr:hypothetical protein JKF63_06098 [Porcisia hertigi]
MESTHYQLNPSTSTFPHHSHLSSQQQQQHQQPHTRADTTVASSLNSSSTASKSGSAIIAASGSLSPYGSPRIAAPNFSATGPVRQPLPAQSQQSHPPYQRAPPKGSSLSPRFSVSNTSMSCSSVEDTGNSCLNPRAIYPGDVHEHHRQTAPGPQQQQQRRHREVMDTVSRNLNTHNEPELEGLQSIHQDGEDEDMMAGHPSTAAGAVAPATTLYSKGFLISTTSAKDLPVPCCNKGGGAYIPPHLHSKGDQQPPSDDGDASFSQTSESRGPTASTSTGISHRLLTLEEINERRRASWAASHSASHAQSVTTGTAAGDNAGGQKGGENPLSNTSNNNLSTVGGVSKGSRPPHRQLMREEADQLIAKRQQQRAAAVVATTKDFSVRQQQPPHKLPLSSTHTTTTSNNNQSVLLPPSLSDNAKPWLLSEDGTQANYFPTAPGSAQQVVHTSPMDGIGNTGTKPMTFEWLRGGGGGGTNSSGTGFFAEAATHSWSGANTWRDPNAAGNSGSDSNTNINTAIAAFLGTAGGTPGDGSSNSDLKTAVNNLGVAGRTPSVVSSAGLTWLPNTSCWTNSHNNNNNNHQQQQQQQQAFLAFAPSAPPPMDHVTTTTTSNFPGGSLRRNSLTMAPPPTANTALQELPREHIEARIQQCDMQLERLRQEREHLAEELQRRIYASASADQQQQRHHTNNATTTNATSWPSTLGRKNVTIPPSVTNGVTTGLAARPLSTATAGTGSITSVSGSVGQNPPWQFWGSPVADNGVIKTASWTTGETHEPPVTCTDSIVKIDGQDWVPRPTTTVMGQAASLAAGGAGAVYKGGAKNTGNWPASERSGARGCHRSEAGNNTSNSRSVHAHSTGRSHGSRSHINNTSSSPTGVGVTIWKSGGGGKVMHNRCSHDNTPQDQKYLQTDPFSMYMHNKKLITVQQASSGDDAKSNAAQQSTT